MTKKIVYVGHGHGLTLTLPVGARSKSIKGRIDLLPGKPVELDAVDADAILITNQRLVQEAKEVSKPVESATIDDSDLVEETVVEEEKAPKKRGPGRRKG